MRILISPDVRIRPDKEWLRSRVPAVLQYFQKCGGFVYTKAIRKRFFFDNDRKTVGLINNLLSDLALKGYLEIVEKSPKRVYRILKVPNQYW